VISRVLLQVVPAPLRTMFLESVRLQQIDTTPAGRAQVGWSKIAVVRFERWKEKKKALSSPVGFHHVLQGKDRGFRGVSWWLLQTCRLSFPGCLRDCQPGITTWGKPGNTTTRHDKKGSIPRCRSSI
jgi:hypothetical protein